MAQEDIFKKLVSHCKEYGYVFQSSEVYDGLAAVYDYGQYGVELKNNIKKYWWDSMVLLHENVVGIDSAIFMHPTVWKASGHVDAFNPHAEELFKEGEVHDGAGDTHGGSAHGQVSLTAHNGNGKTFP